MTSVTVYDHKWSDGLPGGISALDVVSGQGMDDAHIDALPAGGDALRHLTLPSGSSLSAAGIARLAARYPGIEELSLLGLGELDRAQVEALRGFEALRALKVVVKARDVAALDTLDGLRELTTREELFGNGAALPQVERLKLFKSSLDARLAAELAKLPALRHLELSMVKPRGRAPLAGLASAPALEVLALRGYGAMEAAEAKALEGIKTLRRLHTTAASAADIKALSTLCARLERLVLSCGSPTKTDMIEAIVAELPGLYGLSLQLDQGKRHGVPALTLERLAGLHALRWLSLDRNIGLKIEHIDWLGKLPALEALNLNMNAKLSGKIADVLATCSWLRAAHLGGVPMADAGIKKLAGLPLEVLVLSSEKLTSKGIAALSGLRALRELSVTASSVDDAALKALGQLHELEALQLKAPGAVTTLAPLAALPGLRRAALSCASRAACPDGLTQLASSPALGELILSGYEEITDAEAAALAAGPIRSLRGCAPRPELAPHVHIAPEADTTMFGLGAALFNLADALEG
jgi:hypothetical protein